MLILSNLSILMANYIWRILHIIIIYDEFINFYVRMLMMLVILVMLMLVNYIINKSFSLYEMLPKGECRSNWSRVFCEIV